MIAKLLRGGMVLALLTFGQSGDSSEDEIKPTTLETQKDDHR